MQRRTISRMGGVFRTRAPLAAVMAAALALTLSTAARATTYTVDTLVDTAGAGNCSLRDAINAANDFPTSGSTCTAPGTGSDAIYFSSRFRFFFHTTGTIFLVSALPLVQDTNLTINGPLFGITINGQNVSQGVIQVHNAATLNLNNLTIADAIAAGGQGFDNGGGIFNAGFLNVTNCTFSGNSALDGGGIFNSSSLTVTNSTFSSNISDSGGAIDNGGDATITNSTFSDNAGGGPSVGGGGILNTGDLTVTNSTFSGNIALEGNPGGGISNLESAFLTVTNSTFSGNTAPAENDNNGGIGSNSGGGIFNQGVLFLTSSTFSGNSAPTGGGVFNDFGDLARVKSTILAASGGGNCGLGGTITDAGYNISDDASCGFAKTGDAHNGDDVDPLLSPAGLAYNGGPTKTIALFLELFPLASPAIDAIPLADCTDQAFPPKPITTDQRGFVRPAPGHDACDIGAYEYGSHPLFGIKRRLF